MKVEVSKFKKSFNKKAFTLRIESLKIEPGEVIALIGNNGSGKTTLLNALLDLTPLDTGEIRIQGTLHTETDKWLKKAGAYLDESFLFDFMTTKEYFGRLGKNYGIPLPQVEQFLLEHDKFMSSVETGKLIRELSSGNKQKVGIISSLLHDPLLLILDEPFNFLDPGSQYELIAELKKINSNRGMTMIISSHNISHVAELADRILLLQNGELILDKVASEETKEWATEYFRKNGEL